MSNHTSDMGKSEYIQLDIPTTYDEELDAIQFIRRAVRDLEPEVKWRVLDYADRRIRHDTYQSENVAMKQVG